MFNKEKDSYFNDNDIIKSENSFESAFSDKGPEFESAFQKEKAEKRYVFLTLVSPIILLLVSLLSAILSWKHQPVFLYLAMIIEFFVLSIIILRPGLKLRRFLWASIVLALIRLTFIATLGGFIYPRNHEKIQDDSAGISVGE